MVVFRKQKTGETLEAKTVSEFLLGLRDYAGVTSYVLPSELPTLSGDTVSFNDDVVQVDVSRIINEKRIRNSYRTVINTFVFNC